MRIQAFQKHCNSNDKRFSKQYHLQLTIYPKPYLYTENFIAPNSSLYCSPLPVRTVQRTPYAPHAFIQALHYPATLNLSQLLPVCVP